jgi:hypothetical protein
MLTSLGLPLTILCLQQLFQPRFVGSISSVARGQTGVKIPGLQCFLALLGTIIRVQQIAADPRIY